MCLIDFTKRNMDGFSVEVDLCVVGVLIKVGVKVYHKVSKVEHANKKRETGPQVLCLEEPCEKR